MAFPKRIDSYARHTLGDGDGGEAVAFQKRTDSYARHTLGDVDGGEAAATLESMASNTCHTIRLAIIDDGRGDSNCSDVIVGVTTVRTPFIRHCYR